MPLDATEAKPAAELDRPRNPQGADLTALLTLFRDSSAIGPVAATGVLLLGLVAFLYFAKAFLLPAILAVLFSFLLKPVVRGLRHLRIPNAIGAAIAVAMFISVTGTALYTVNQPAKVWLSKTPESLNKLERKARELLQEAERFIRRGRQVEETDRPVSATKNVLADVQLVSVANTVLSYTTSFLAGTLELLVLLYFLLAAGDGMLQRLVRVLPRLRDKQEAVAIVHQLERTVSRYLATVTIINAGHGLAVGFAAYWIGLPNPGLWGVMAFLLNFIPYFGPLTGAIILTLAGFLEFDSLGRALAPALAYLAVHTVESNFITPTVLGRRLTLNPIMIFLALMFWTWLWGVPGALLATPLLMTFKILCDHIKPLAWVGEFLSG